MEFGRISGRDAAAAEQFITAAANEFKKTGDASAFCKKALEWVRITKTASPEASETVSLDVIEKANKQGVETLLVPVSFEAVQAAPDSEKHHYVQVKDNTIYGSDEAIKDIFDSKIALVQENESGETDLVDLSDHEVVRILPEAWVGMINNIALEVLSENKPKEESDSKVPESRGGPQRADMPKATESKSLISASKKENYSPTLVANTNSVLAVSTAAFAMSTKKLDSEKDAKEEIVKDREEDRSETHAAQGRGGTPTEKAEADLNAVERKLESESTVERKNQNP